MTELFNSGVEWRRYWAFLASDVVLFDHESSSEMCSSRNTLLLTLSTVDVQCGMLGITSPEIDHNLFGIFQVQGEIAVFTQVLSRQTVAYKRCTGSPPNSEF